MKTYRDKGFVIKIKQFPEADKLAVFLTRNHGIVESIAKGASKSSSKKVTSIDLLNHVKTSFYVTKGIDLLKEIEVINDYQQLKSDSEISKNLLYVLEIIDKINASSGQELKAYNLLYNFLELSNALPQKFQLLLACFEIKLLELAGFSPKLNAYTKTEKPILKNESRILASGHILGYNEAGSNHADNHVSDKIIKTQRFFLENEIHDCLKLKVDNDLLNSLQYINRYWIENTIEKRLKSASLLNN